MRLGDRWTATCGFLAVSASVLAIGGALRWTQALVAGLLALALVPMLYSRRTFGRVSPLLAVLCLPLVLTLLQLIPVPDAISNSLDPVGNGLRADGAELTNTTPWHGLSLDA